MHSRSTVVQVGYLVADVERSARDWNTLLGAGPFVVTPSIRLEYVHRGRPATVEASAALGQAGEVQIELIQQDSPGPSFYRDAIPEGAEGLHHIALVVEDLDAEVRRLEALGIPTAARIEFGGMRVAHMDTVARLGFMIELIERNTASETLFQMTHSASTEWDGRDPLRPVAGFQPA